MTRLLVVGILIVNICLTGTLSASSVCGVVSNVIGEPLTRATISLVRLDGSGERYSGQADQEGKACVDEVPDGLYSIESQAPGFTPSRYSPVRVSFPVDVHLDFRLPVGTSGSSDEIVSNAILRGILMNGAVAYNDAGICLTKIGETVPAVCTTTNHSGQYILGVDLGEYNVQITRASRSDATTINVMFAGEYLNRLTIPFVQTVAPKAESLLSKEAVWMLVMNTPEALHAEGRGGCPDAELVPEGTFLMFVQLRNACPASGSGLIDNYTVDLRTGKIWTGIDTRVYIESERLRRLRALLGK